MNKDQKLLEEAYKQVVESFLAKNEEPLILVNELFDTTKKLKWQKSSLDDYSTKFKAPNGRTYEIDVMKSFYINFPDKVYQSYEGDDKSFHRMFSDDEAYTLEFGDEEHGKDITGEGSSAAVFGIVINAVKKLVESTPSIKTLFLSAKEPSRRSLYSRLVPLFARQLGWNFQISKNKKYYYLEKPE